MLTRSRRKQNDYKSKTKSLIALWLQSSICPLATITLHSVRATYSLFFLLFCSKSLRLPLTLCPSHTPFALVTCVLKATVSLYLASLVFSPCSPFFSSVSTLALPSGNNVPPLQCFGISFMPSGSFSFSHNSLVSQSLFNSPVQLV